MSPAADGTSSWPRVPLTRPSVGEAEAEAVRRVLLSGWLAQGPELAAFEAEFAAYVGAPQAVAVSNCTAALELLLHALGVGPGDEVVTPSHSFIAAANAIRRLGARPVFVDIEPGGYNADPLRVEGAIGPRTAAILAVHQLGMPCDLAALAGIAEARGVSLIEDAACAAGSEVLWQGTWEKIGRPHGVAACFSFHPRKIMTTGEGGMITTADVDFAARLRRLRAHGMDLDTHARHLGGVLIERYDEPGFNMRMTDMQAALGRVQLAGLDGEVRRRRALAARYARLLAAIPGVRTPVEPDWARSNWQSYCVRPPEGADQTTVMRRLADAGVASRRGVMCVHREAAYPRGSWSCRPEADCGCGEGRCDRLRLSEAAQEGSLQIPLFGAMTEAEQDQVVAALATACRP